MRITLQIALLLSFLVTHHQVPATELAGKEAQEQTSFCEEGAPDNLRLKPVPLPKVVLSAVMNTKEGKEARKFVSSEGKELNPATLLKGTSLHLSNSHDLFFIVMGLSPMSGADNTWFWIVRQSGNNTKVLLFAGANCLDVSRRKTLGYNDIETTWSSAAETVTETYRYDRKSYKLWKRNSQPK